ncbi:MAG: D-glycero-beta-D-manno-heptose 1-phosphate adenylyltransferase [Candidatus Eisenbacteria bacterium]|uniref:D-glycero-beta-D-manno-heptose 1-phosphate adenylyltransferase n=1 Tax=Eiseniibacteriota bacterium TaxID=2212470 RepID=A0A937XAH4_UNCEI|nr:D-glycero-beta-D-manno-heptose 1-phosphate adenylyltransferase [Candidatus Eisenbacteria bacterium]
MSADARILDREALIEALRPRRASGERVVFTNGCFDLLHAGHVELLESAAALGDILVVGLNSDLSVRRLKGPGRPLVPQAERARLLAALRAVDRVVLFDEETPLLLIEALLPDVLVKGEDYAAEAIVGREAVEAAGGRVVRVPLLPGLSTSALVARLREKPDNRF